MGGFSRSGYLGSKMGTAEEIGRRQFDFFSLKFVQRSSFCTEIPLLQSNTYETSNNERLGKQLRFIFMLKNWDFCVSPARYMVITS